MLLGVAPALPLEPQPSAVTSAEANHTMLANVETLRQLGLTRSDILGLDATLFSNAEKQAYIELLYGKASEWTWKRDLQAANLNRHRWNHFLSVESGNRKRYRMSHESIAEIARRNRPSSPGSNVTDFTDWIYRLYLPERQSRSLLLGRLAEREIARRTLSIPKHGRWKLIHCGIGDAPDAALTIPSLRVNGAPMRGCPDLVFREKETNRILVVELKVTEAEIPLDGWPNLEAQLWAYSHIPWPNAGAILLVGEVWGFTEGLRLRPPAIRYSHGDSAFHQRNLQLFAAFGGTLDTREQGPPRSVRA